MRPIALLLAVAAAASLPEAADGAFQAGLAARLDLVDPAGGAPLPGIDAGRPFRVALTFTDAASGLPARGLRPAAWIRPADASNPSCLEAARSFRATQRLPTGAIDLNGILVGVAHRDAQFSIVDPRLDLATSNALLMVPMPDAAGAIVADRARQGFLLADRASGEVRLVAQGSTNARYAASTADGLVAGAGGDAVWATRGASLALVGSDGGLVRSLPLAAPAERLTAVARERDDDLRDAFVLEAGGTARHVDRTTGAATFYAGPPAATEATYVPEAGAAIFADGSAFVRIAWPDGEAAEAIALAAAADEVSVAPGGATALAWSTRNTALTLIEVATARAVQAVSFDRPPREIAFAGRSAFVLADDLSFVHVIDLGAPRAGETAAVRSVRIGVPVPSPADRGDGPFLASLAPSPQVLALHPGLATAFVVMEDQVGTAPMSSVRLAGARPTRIAVLDRALREAGEGRYETVASVPHAGSFELVVTTGIAGLSTCFPLAVKGETRPAVETISLLAETADPAGGAVRLRLRAFAADGAEIRLPDRLGLSLIALESGWREAIVARRTPDGLVAKASPRHPGLYSVVLEDIPPDGILVSPSLVSIRP